MSPLEKEPQGGAPVRLLPHQVTFVEAVLGAAGKRVTLLRGDVGLGKSTALVALASRLLQEQPTARSLFLVPAALRLQFVDTLRKAGTPALLVDRYQFREMVDSAIDEFWPRGAVAVLSREFARQVDILESLASIHWDLVVADEARSFTGASAELLRRVGAVAERLVLATASSIPLPDGFSTEDAAVVQWHRDQLVDREGKPLDIVPRPVLHEVHFDLSQAERSLLVDIGELCRILEAGTTRQGVVAKALLRSARSSTAPLEAMLQRLAASDGADDSWAGLEAPDDETAGEEPDGTIDGPSVERIGAVVGRALQDIEAIQADSKINAFAGLLSGLGKADMPTRRVCVLTNFTETCFYLAAEIENRGQHCQVLNGRMASDDRVRALATFTTAGEILVATRTVMMEGIDVSRVTDLVLYDIPNTEAALQQVLGRFDRFGRLSQLNVHVLVSSHSADGVNSEPLGLLREVVVGRSEP